MRKDSKIDEAPRAHATEAIMRSTDWKPKIAEKSMQLDEPKKARAPHAKRPYLFDINRKFFHNLF